MTWLNMISKNHSNNTLHTYHFFKYLWYKLATMDNPLISLIQLLLFNILIPTFVLLFYRTFIKILNPIPEPIWYFLLFINHIFFWQLIIYQFIYLLHQSFFFFFSSIPYLIFLLILTSFFLYTLNCYIFLF